MKSDRVCVGTKSGWTNVLNKHRTLTQETEVCVPCKNLLTLGYVYENFTKCGDSQHAGFIVPDSFVFCEGNFKRRHVSVKLTLRGW